MKVNISVVGRFHAFDLAKSFQEKKILNKLITTYPKFITSKWGIEKTNVISEVYLELINRYKNKTHLVSKVYLNSLIQKKHAKNSAKYLKDCDIFIGWSGSSLETLIEAKKQNKITILERGSSHYNYQMEILSEVNENFVPDYNTWQRELLEYQLADYISIPSSYVKRTFIKNGISENKLIVNPYGVDLNEFKQIKKEDEIFRIIFAGGGTFRKGYHLLLQAFSELNLDNCELWHLGSVQEEMKPYLKKYKTKKFILKGHQPQNKLYEFYSQGSVFVMPSLEDGFGMVIFQAMSCGLPVILSENTGAYDAITKNGEEGFVIPIRDVEAIKEKILYLYNNQDIAKEMGQKAKERVHSSFTWEDYGNRYLKNLEEIYANKNK